MTIRRIVARLLLVALVALCLVLAGSWLLRARLAAMGVEQLSVSGIELGWNRLAFESVSMTWSGDAGSVSVQSSGPRLVLDWAHWQLDRLTAGPTQIRHIGSLTPGVAETDAAGDPGNGFSLTLPDSAPFWLPRHLEIESLRAEFPCQGTRCHLEGRLEFDREAQRARARVDATLTRDSERLEMAGDLRLGAGPDGRSQADGEFRVQGLRTWLPRAMARDIQALVPHSALVRFGPAGRAEPGAWPVSVNVTTEGGARPAFHGRVILHTAEPWRVEIDQGQFSASADQWQQAGWLLDGLRAELFVSGTVSAAQSRLTLAPQTALTIRHADPVEARQLMWLDDIRLQPESMTLTLRGEQLTARGPVSLSIGEVRYPGLVTQAWHAGADLQWRRTLDLDGSLGNAAGMTLPVRVTYQPGQSLQATLSMALTPDNQANHLAETLTAWPQGLVIEDGRVDGTADIRLPVHGAPAFSGEVTFTEVSGLVANTAWQGLSGSIHGQGQEQLTLASRALMLTELNPGIPIGPVHTEARYQAGMAAPGSGTLTLPNAWAGFAGGTVAIADGTTLDLTEEAWEIPVKLRDIQLSALMNLYPTEGLAGEGTLEGTLPVRLGPAGIRIDGGRITALPPGGRLQLPADRLGSLAQDNAAMALVTRAMQNFHYRLLESTIDYREDGTLLLDLKLRGSSPEVDSDRPVVLNINLQEDIPALLTSLQLSGRVNEAVTERVRERLRQEGGGSD